MPRTLYATRLVWDHKLGGIASFDDGEMHLTHKLRGPISLADGDHLVEIDYKPHAIPPVFWIRQSGKPGELMTDWEREAAQYKLEAMMHGARQGFATKLPK